MEVMKRLTACFAVSLLMLAIAPRSEAALINPDGSIDGWGFTPFSNTVLGVWNNGRPPLPDGSLGTDRGQTGGIFWTEGNNASEVPQYPVGGGPSYVPAPTGNVTAGETFDLELLAFRIVGNSLQVLSITSMNPNTGSTYNGRTFHMGDVFMDVDRDGTYDFALTGGKWDTNLGPSYTHQQDEGIYLAEPAHMRGITANGGFGGFPTIPPLTNPVAVDDGATQVDYVGSGSGLFDFRRAVFDYGNQYGANENGTWALEWTIDLSLLGISLETLMNNGLFLHQSNECGNDLITDDGVPVPEPATVALLGFGLASMGLVRRRFIRRR